MKNWLVRHKWDIPLAIVFLGSVTFILQVQPEGTSWHLLTIPPYWVLASILRNKRKQRIMEESRSRA
ncbi:hypothetical protein [Robertmurraya korlensis]|uniref:hypothetical protein n=1 Tax=Robertmurraya korlensis TaxID=519977 RepID=UPI000826CC41|nr:hypothetical protein [Robertmurraya korlensis]